MMKLFLAEGVADARKYYPTIEDDLFNKLIALDPTFNPNKDRLGSYGKWILDLYKRGNLKEEDFYKVTSYLTKFDSIKKNLPQKDISSYRTLPDLARTLDSYVEPEQTERQKLRQLRKDIRHTDLGEEAELVFEDDDWEIWIPKTYKASCKLGQNSHWCTATTDSDNYYQSYTRQGPLYIILNKHDDQEKYQFHFESESFMDINDEAIEFTDFLSNERFKGVADFFKSRFDKMLDLDESGHAVVHLDFDDFAEAASGRDMRSDFIEACLEGDVFEFFDTYDEETFEYLGIEDRISEENYAALSEKGYSKEDVEDAVAEDSELEDLHECLQRAVDVARAYGAADECLKDFYDAFNALASPEHCESVSLDIDKQEVKFVFDKAQLLNAIQEYGTWNNGLHAITIYFVEQYFDFVEPYYGWDGFNDDIFNERLDEIIHEDLPDKSGLDEGLRVITNQMRLKFVEGL